MPEPKEHFLMRTETPNWKWIAGLSGTVLLLVCGVVGVLFSNWMTSISNSIDASAKSNAESVRVQQTALQVARDSIAQQAERLAAIESWRLDTGVRLDRLDRGVDTLGTKMDRLLERTK